MHVVNPLFIYYFFIHFSHNEFLFLNFNRNEMRNDWKNICSAILFSIVKFMHYWRYEKKRKKIRKTILFIIFDHWHEFYEFSISILLLALIHTRQCTSLNVSDDNWPTRKCIAIPPILLMKFYMKALLRRIRHTFVVIDIIKITKKKKYPHDICRSDS